LKILLLDNYDSFTFNLFHYLVGAGADVEVFRNNEISVSEAGAYDAIVFSPGPGLPDEAGLMMSIIAAHHQNIPMLGVCLGHQAIVQFFGGSLENLVDVCHGHPTITQLDSSSPLFRNLERQVQTGHYHSWIASKENFPKQLKVTAENDRGWIMAIEHNTLPIYGVQFHPESVLTPEGYQMIENWIQSLEQ
jgi:anthranilate synthase component 2